MKIHAEPHVMAAVVVVTVTVAVVLVAYLCGSRLKGGVDDDEYEAIPIENAVGPESFAFDPRGGGPYTGVSDGRIIKWDPTLNRWLNFALTFSPTRGKDDDEESESEECGGSIEEQKKKEHICGRPLGLCFSNHTGELYVADAYKGLLVVGPHGGAASSLITSTFTNSLDIDQTTGLVYFTTSSSIYHRRVLKYWLSTPKAGTLEHFADLPGFPDNIKRSPRGGFWVGIHSRRQRLIEWILSYDWIGKVLVKVPLDITRIYSYLAKLKGSSGIVIRLSEEGDVLEVVEGLVGNSISEVEEKDGVLWVGSIDTPFAGKYKRIVK
ncbi:protein STRICTOSIDINE SYNTHASE-LIKE 2 isoform X2 [Arachis hypogaea]|uniref:protein STRICTOSIDINE SYNTHASE-LIKE 2 isoform X2 n=1 Tax=Arachis hypogaea TaxID=3818 RepID=UPI000DEC7BB8|nr:protein STRICTOSIDINE SYNTHASE-LIKE 2 isoform X2 [Arachis hypogaea]